MNASRELDAEIGEKVMGVEPGVSWNVLNSDETTSAYWGPSRKACAEWLAGVLEELPDSWLKDYHVGSWKVSDRYSTDIKAAWTVVAKMRERGFLFSAIQFETSDWEVEFHDNNKTGVLLPGSGSVGHGRTAELAICLAARRAIEPQGGAVEFKNITGLLRDGFSDFPQVIENKASLEPVP